MPFDLQNSGPLKSAYLFDHLGREITPGQYGGGRMPAGRQVDADAGFEDREDGLDLPHILTFGSIYQGASYTYLHQWDEAMTHSRRNALAMRRDAWIMSLLRERADETLHKEWHLECDNPKDPWQKTVADGVTKIIKAIPHLFRMRRYLLQGKLWYGRYASNLKWEWKDMALPVMSRSGPAQPGVKASPTMAKGKVLTVTKHKPVSGDKIGFHHDDTPYVLCSSAWHDKIRGDYRLIYPTGAGAPAILLRGTWREKFLICQNEPDDADWFEPEFGERVHGVGIRNTIYWLDFLRRDYFGAITEMLNRIGLGLVVLKYDQSNHAAKQQALSIAKKFSRRSVVVMPVSPDRLTQGGAVEVVEAPSAGAAIMLDLQKHVEDQIERYCVGQNISSGSKSSNPLEGTGKAMFAKDSKTQLCMGDANDFDEDLTGDDAEPGLVHMIKKWTYSFADFPLRWVTDHERDNPKEILESVKTCVDMGVAFDEEDVRPLTGLPAPEEGAVIIGGKQALAEQQAAEMAGKGFPPGQGGEGEEGGDEEGMGQEEELPPFPQDEQQYAINFDESKHRRGQPQNAGQFGPGGGGKKPEGKISAKQPANKAAASKGIKLKTAKARAFDGKPVVVNNQISKQEAGRIGEEVVIAWLHSQGMKDARHMNLDRNNFPIDLIQDHACLEVKTGNVANGAGAQQWRLTIGEPGKAEKEWLASASAEEKAAWNAKKQTMIHERKKKALADLSEKLGKPIKAKTITCLINPDTKTVDLYVFDGWHDRIGWNSDMAKKAYAGSVNYA